MILQMTKRINNLNNLSLEKILKSNFFLNQRLPNDFHSKWQRNKEKKFWYSIVKRYDFYLTQSKRNQIVPKKIHQIWLGSNVPKKYKKWIQDWKKYNPDFEYCLWTEEKILKLDLVNRDQFIKAKNYGVKSDIARNEILLKFGGIYIDVDFEPLKKINKKLLTFPFLAGNMFDLTPAIANGLMISEPKSKLLELLVYNLGNCPRELLTANQIMSYCGPYYLTKIIKKNFDSLKDIIILPSQYFYPWPNFLINEKYYRKDYVTSKSFAIHHWHTSWFKKSIFQRILIKINYIIKSFWTLN